MAEYKLFKVGLNGDYDIIAAETEEQALAHHLDLVGPDDYSEDEMPEVSEVAKDAEGIFETETGGFERMTYAEFLADFKYEQPAIVCWFE
ncbi:hypothetical protein ACO0DA_20240 [Bacillus subtilis]|uniref:hypothetical protein n=1 Tax=Bacillus subtilis TaxID=1423 RepID=UPI00217CE480|nr:hypothetical protein [Bacillus subtilis]UWJ02589.1 hypothetical protein N0B18_06810 [Bacillus subtilis]